MGCFFLGSFHFSFPAISRTSKMFTKKKKADLDPQAFRTKSQLLLAPPRIGELPPARCGAGRACGSIHPRGPSEAPAAAFKPNSLLFADRRGMKNVQTWDLNSVDRIHFAPPKTPWNDTIPLQVPTNCGSPWFQSGAKWISSIHSMSL